MKHQTTIEQAGHHALRPIPSNHWVCMTCGTPEHTHTRTQGSLLIEIILWLFFLVPGIIYTVWRHTTRCSVCASCGSDSGSIRRFAV